MDNPIHVRAFHLEDLDSVMELWLNANRQAHPFIPPAHWEQNLDLVRSLIPQAEVYVSGAPGMTDGFIGITEGDYIAGLFVAEQSRGHGIGKALLDHVKQLHPLLKLHVYQKNSGAVRFYLREGFTRAAEQIDSATGESELLLVWENKV